MPAPKIDWLSITILYRKDAHIDQVHKLDLNTVLHLLKLEEFSDCFVPMKGIHRYQFRYSHHGVTINEPSPDRLVGDGTQEHSGMGYNISMSSGGLNFYQAYQKDHIKGFDFRKLLKELMNHPLYEIHCSRIDIAMDDTIELTDKKRKPLLDLDKIKNCVDEKQIKTRMRRMEVTETRAYTLRKDSDTGFCKPEPVGRTIYFGSRQSEKYVRIYDKFAEQLKKTPDDPYVNSLSHWVRFEVEYKGDTAGAILNNYVLPQREWEEFYLSHARDLLDFAENGKTASWWKEFCENREPAHLYVTRKHADTSDFVHMSNVFFKQMGRNALTVMLGQGPGTFFDVLIGNFPRLKRRHYSSLKGYCQDLQLDGKRGFRLFPDADSGGMESMEQLELNDEASKEEFDFDIHSVDFLRESAQAIKETRQEINELSDVFRPDPRFEVTPEEMSAMLYRLQSSSRQWW